MSVIEILILTAMTVALIPAARGGRRLWRHESKIYDRVPAWWLYGEVAHRGWIRGMPVGSLSFVFLLASAWIAIPLGGFENGHGGIWRQAFLVPVTCFCLCFVLRVTVFLFNRPRFIVAPHLPSQPGALHEYLARHRSSERSL